MYIGIIQKVLAQTQLKIKNSLKNILSKVSFSSSASLKSFANIFKVNFSVSIGLFGVFTESVISVHSVQLQYLLIKEKDTNQLVQNVSHMVFVMLLLVAKDFVFLKPLQHIIC